MTNVLKASIAALALGTALPAAATVAAPGQVSFDLTGSDTQVTGSMTNTKIFSAIGSDGKTYQLQASAWEIDGAGTLSQAHLGDYSHGLGSTNKDDNNGEWNEHEIDNLHGSDFILLQFDHAVTLTSASLTPFNLLYWMPNDTDATTSYATSGAAWNGTPSMSYQLLTDLVAHAQSVPGSGAPGSVSMNSAANSGNVWVIGADMFGVDCNYDGFKLAGVTVNEITPSVPEPATWATMLVGFGAVGSAMRRRAGRRALQAV